MSYELIDISGKKLISINEESVNNKRLDINISTLNSGIYLLRVATNLGDTTLKFIKN